MESLGVSVSSCSLYTLISLGDSNLRPTGWSGNVLPTEHSFRVGTNLNHIVVSFHVSDKDLKTRRIRKRGFFRGLFGS